jgi:hypothetical protein
MTLARGQRKGVALAALVILAAVAWQSMDAGSIRTLVFVLLGGFALRVVLTPGRSPSGKQPYGEQKSPE